MNMNLFFTDFLDLLAEVSTGDKELLLPERMFYYLYCLFLLNWAQFISIVFLV